MMTSELAPGIVREASRALNQRSGEQPPPALPPLRASPRERPRSDSYNPWKNDDFALRQLAWQSLRAPRPGFPTVRIRKKRRPASLPELSGKDAEGKKGKKTPRTPRKQGPAKKSGKQAWTQQEDQTSTQQARNAPTSPKTPRPPGTPKRTPRAKSPPQQVAGSTVEENPESSLASEKARLHMSPRTPGSKKSTRASNRQPLEFISEDGDQDGGIIQYQDVKHAIDTIKESAIETFDKELAAASTTRDYIRDTIASIQQSALENYARELAEPRESGKGGHNPINSKAVIHKRKGDGVERNGKTSTSQEIMKGTLSDLPPPTSNTTRIFLSSTFSGEPQPSA